LILRKIIKINVAIKCHILFLGLRDLLPRKRKRLERRGRKGKEGMGEREKAGVPSFLQSYIDHRITVVKRLNKALSHLIYEGQTLPAGG